MPICNCESHGCKGEELSYDMLKKHQRADRMKKRRDSTTDTPHSLVAETSAESHTISSQVVPDTNRQHATPAVTQTGFVVVNADQRRIRDTYDTLAALDDKLAKHFTTISDLSPESALLTIEETWFRSTLRDLQSVDSCGDDATILLKEAIHARINEAIQIIAARTVQAKVAISESEVRSNVFNTGA